MDQVKNDFIKMTKIQWNNIENVGDASSYITDIEKRLSLSIPSLAKHLSKNYFATFCDNLVMYF